MTVDIWIFGDIHTSLDSDAQAELDNLLPDEVEVLCIEKINQKSNPESPRYVWVKSPLAYLGLVFFGVIQGVQMYRKRGTFTAAGVQASRNISVKRDIPIHEIDLNFRDRVAKQSWLSTLISISLFGLSINAFFQPTNVSIKFGFILFLAIVDGALFHISSLKPRERAMIDRITKIHFENGYRKIGISTGDFHVAGLVRLAERMGYNVRDYTIQTWTGKLRFLL